MRVAFCDMAQKRWKVLPIDNSFYQIVLVITNIIVWQYAATI